MNKKQIERKIYVDINEENELSGFFDSYIHERIPQTAVEITLDFRDSIISQNKRFKVIDKDKPLTAENLQEIIPQKIERPPTALEKLQADVDFLMIMEGYADV